MAASEQNIIAGDSQTNFGTACNPITLGATKSARPQGLREFA
ncbi:hypothetical protein QMA67_00050 [Gluconobacter japonicus]|nr:hypothetical protein [Gluconobacter japonicus]MDI6651330.1 hypothetical protein [Gluconobacter japonicus]